MKAKCTHGKGFCPVHQARCDVHYYLMPDGHCTCKPCDKVKSKKLEPSNSKFKEFATGVCIAKTQSDAVVDYQFRRVAGFVLLRTPNPNNSGALVITESHIGHGLSIGTAKRLYDELKRALLI